MTEKSSSLVEGRWTTMEIVLVTVFYILILAWAISVTIWADNLKKDDKHVCHVAIKRYVD